MDKQIQTFMSVFFSSGNVSAIAVSIVDSGRERRSLSSRGNEITNVRMSKLSVATDNNP